jgi:ATP phosphoribosyltransferase regulatory subunit
VDVAQIGFEAAYGLTAMEYYDGFVFGFYAAKPGWPAIASGGRYDALTRVLGQGRAVPAVGGIIRPEYSLRVEAGSAS